MMKNAILLIIVVLQFSCNAQNNNAAMKNKIAIAIHGGAGDLKSLNLTPEQEQAHLNTLSAALDAGYAILKNGGTSLDAVETAVKMLEDSPLFNAGKGSVFTADGTNEMDAAIMDGKTLKCGAVTCVRTIKNPIAAARMVMDSARFVFLSGEGAEKFAKEQGLEIVSPSYFYSPERWEQLQKMKESDSTGLDHDRGKAQPVKENVNEKLGTVGCVALDAKGNLAAATSTGGIVNKKYHRIGDTPVIGAGTYANNKTCAVSCTGRGEYFIRLVAAHDVSALMEYKDYSLKSAMKTVIEKVKDLGGRGGMIGIDREGNIFMPFTTTGMFRGMIDKKGTKSLWLYEAED